MTQTQPGLVFSKEELNTAEKLRAAIKTKLEQSEFASELSSTVVVQLSLDDSGNIKWGNVYVDANGFEEDREVQLWNIVHDVVDFFSGNNGFPSSLITVRPT